jgi:hypothetical protein
MLSGNGRMDALEARLDSDKYLCSTRQGTRYSTDSKLGSKFPTLAPYKRYHVLSTVVKYLYEL